MGRGSRMPVAGWLVAGVAHASGPDPERCDGVDNDGNGLVDDGVVATTDGTNHDSAADALRAAVAGSTVALCEDSWIATGVDVPAGATLVGHAAGGPVELTGTYAAGYLLGVEAGAEAHLENLWLHGEPSDWMGSGEHELFVHDGASVSGSNLLISSGGLHVGEGASIWLVDSVAYREVSTERGAFVALLGSSIIGGVVLDDDSTLWGGTVTNAHGNAVEAYPGGVVVGVDVSGSPIGIRALGATLQACHVHHNESGIYGTDLVILDSIVEDNTEYSGLQVDGVLTLRDTVIRRNTGSSGGGIRGWSLTLDAERTVVEGNTAETGGGLAIGAADAPSVIRGLELRDNSAQHGGGLYVESWRDEAPAPVTLDGVSVVGNVAKHSGGGVFVGASVVVRSSTVWRNTAAIGGAAAVAAGGSLSSDCSDWGAARSPEDNDVPDVDAGGALWSLGTSDFACDATGCAEWAPLCEEPVDEVKR